MPTTESATSPTTPDTAIAIANTVVMAARERVPDVAQLRLAGATPRQARRVLLWESGLISSIGVLLGIAVTPLALAATTAAARTVNPGVQPSAPWLVLAGTAAGAVAIVHVATFATGTIAARRRPLEGLGVNG